MAQAPSVMEKESEQSAIDNLHTLGDVRKIHELRLRRILPHATADQLEHIEACTKGRDLSSITDELWKKHFCRKFGEDTANKAQERMIKGREKVKWRSLYKAKSRQQERLQSKGVERLKQLYQEQDAKKASKKVQFIDITPPEPKKRAKTTTTMLGAATSSAAPAISDSKKPASSKAPAAETGWSNSSKGQTEKQVQKEPSKRGGPERGRLWRKSIKDHDKEQSSLMGMNSLVEVTMNDVPTRRLQKRRVFDKPLRILRV